VAFFSKPIDDDMVLVEKYQRTSDPEVMGLLYEKYMHLVYGVCLKYLKGRQEAQDAVVQIFEKLIADLPHQSIRQFKPWLYVVTKNYCLMELRRMKGSTRFEKDIEETNVLFMESEPSLHPLDSEDGQVLTAALHDCIKQLRDVQRQCIERFYFNDKCYQEISDEFDIDLNKVKSYIQNGKRNLKICLESKHEIRETI
jgi:RNA polymerase sigma-70 factor (ECF subfamily)